jgi:hypothetical protein
MLWLLVVCRGFASSAAGIFSVASFLLQVDQQHVDHCGEMGVFHLFFCLVCQQ